MKELLYKTLQTFYESGEIVLPLLGVAVILGSLLARKAYALQGLTDKDYTRAPLYLRAEEVYQQALMAPAQHRSKLLEHNLQSLVEESREHNRMILSLIAVSPLLGLLGTVSGMIATFDALGDFSSSQQGAGVASGISQALLTTQIGLSIAIPGVLIFRWISRRERFFESLTTKFKASLRSGAIYEI